MVSFRSSVAFAAMAMFSLSRGQTQYEIDPESVPIGTRDVWCQSQKAACPLLCLQNPKINDASTQQNDCDSKTLTYQCICGNGVQPDIGNFSQTIPFFKCQEYGNQCVNQCASADTPCQSACRSDNPCGAQNPTRVNLTSSSTTMEATGTGTATNTGGTTVFTGLGGDSSSSSSSSSKSGSQAALSIGHSYGIAVGFAGLIGGFALFL